MVPERIPPTFIGGCGRSGTTFVVDVLGNHPQISPIYETDFVVQLLWARKMGRLNAAHFLSYMDEWSCALPHRPHNKKTYERYCHGPHYFLPTRQEVIQATQLLLKHLTEHVDFDLAARQFIEGLFDRHAARDQKPHWVNKTPLYVTALPTLQKLFPEMRFLHVIREAGDTARSIVSRPWGPNRYSEAVSYRNEHVAAGRAWGEVNERNYLEVEYDTLVRCPRDTLVNVMNWIGVATTQYPFQRVQVRAS